MWIDCRTRHQTIRPEEAIAMNRDRWAWREFIEDEYKSRTRVGRNFPMPECTKEGFGTCVNRDYRIDAILTGLIEREKPKQATRRAKTLHEAEQMERRK